MSATATNTTATSTTSSPSTSLKDDLAIPLEVIDNCIGKKIWVILKTKKEYLGTLVGFDEFVNIVLDNCQELYIYYFLSNFCSEMQSDGAYMCENVGQILLNNNSICLLIPDGKGPI